MWAAALIAAQAPALAGQAASEGAATAAAPVYASALRGTIIDFKKIDSNRQGDGYASAQIRVNYRFLVCGGDIALAYSLDPTSITASPNYWARGTIVPAAGAVPRPSAIEFTGAVYSGPALVGRFEDKSAREAMPLGCAGQAQKIGVLSDYLGPRATTAQVQSFLDDLSVRTVPMTIALVNPALVPAPVQEPPRVARVPDREAGEVASLNAQIDANNRAIDAQNAKALADYYEQLKQSRDAVAEFTARRAEYEAELKAAREARARYEQQIGGNAPR